MKTVHAVIITGASVIAIAGGGVGTASAAGAFSHTTTIIERVAAAPAPAKAPPSPAASTRVSSPTPPAASPSAAAPEAADATRSPSPAASPPLAPSPILVVGEEYSGMRPTTVDPSADGNGAVTGITWSQWDSLEAVGYGYQRHNDCEPDCAQGTITYSPAEIVLGGVAGSSSTNGGHYTTISVANADGSEDMAWGTTGPQPVSILENAEGGEQGDY